MSTQKREFVVFKCGVNDYSANEGYALIPGGRLPGGCGVHSGCMRVVDIREMEAEACHGCETLRPQTSMYDSRLQEGQRLCHGCYMREDAKIWREHRG